jgi:hypothetical protein
MPTMFCPGCGKSISLEEKAKGFCPGCGKPLPTTDGSVAPRPAAEVPRPASRPAAATLQPVVEPEEPAIPREVLGWGTVRAGLALTVFGAILFFACVFVLLAVWITTGENPLTTARVTEPAAIGPQTAEPTGTNVLTVVVTILSQIGLPAALVLAMAGAFMGCAAPERSGVRGLAISFSALLALAIVLAIVLAIAVAEKRHADEENLRRFSSYPSVSAGPAKAVTPTFGPDEIRIVLFALCAAVILSQLFYMLFLRKAALYFDRDSLALGVVCYIAFFLLYCGGVFLVATDAVEVRIRPAGGEGPLWVFLGAWVTLCVWGVVLVGLVRGAVTRGILKS